jgi:hypothetical protein
MAKASWAALAVAALWLPFVLRSAGATPSTSSAERTAAPPVAPSEARAELAHMRADLARAERRLAQLETTEHVQSAQVGQAEPNTTAAQAPSGEVTDEQRRGRVEQTFTAERADTDSKPERALDTVLRELLPAGSSVLAIDCRDTLCRVETSHPDGDSQRAYVGAIALPRPDRTRPFDGALFDSGEQLADGRTVRSVTYFVRPGRELPGAAP